MALFTADTHFDVYMNAKDPAPSQELHSRQSTIFTLEDERATREAYTLAHHVTVDGAKQNLMLASLRNLNTFLKADGVLMFAERLLYVEWQEHRDLS